jgi:hypothetical protein
LLTHPTAYGKYAIASENQATDAATIVDDFREKNDLLRHNLMGGEV